ncbi:MAG: STAS domain-containing protein [Roseiarcus sp.]
MQFQSAQLSEGVVKVTLVGRLDIAGSLAIDTEINDLASVNKNMVVDMTGVDFLASLGIRTLLTCAKKLHQRGGGLALLGPQPPVREVLEVSGVLGMMPAFASQQEALKSLGA